MYAHFAFLAEKLRSFNQPVVILDLEATDGNHGQARIIEIAYLYFNQQEIKSVQYLVYPEESIRSFITELTGIDDEMLADAPLFSEILPAILPDLQGSLLIAHQSAFDLGLLERECALANVPFSMPHLCSVKLSKNLYPKEKKHNLDELAKRFDIQIEGHRHRAMTDVLILAEFLQKSLKEPENSENWFKIAQKLRLPTVEITHFPANIRADLYFLGNQHGVISWLDIQNKTIQNNLLEKSFVDACTILHKQSDLLQRVVNWHFTPTVGALHSLQTALEQYDFKEKKDKQASELCVVSLHKQKNDTDAVKLRFQPLLADFYDEPPLGIFPNAHIAQKVALRWAKKYHICPTLLGLNPHKLPSDAPCPAAQIGTCSEACHQQNIDLHNDSVYSALTMFPMGSEYSLPPEVEITEQCTQSGRKETFFCTRGCLKMNDGSWYLSPKLLNIIKNKAKHHIQSIRSISRNPLFQIAKKD